MTDICLENRRGDTPDREIFILCCEPQLMGDRTIFTKPENRPEFKLLI